MNSHQRRKQRRELYRYEAEMRIKYPRPGWHLFPSITVVQRDDALNYLDRLNAHIDQQMHSLMSGLSTLFDNPGVHLPQPAGERVYSVANSSSYPLKEFKS